MTYSGQYEATRSPPARPSVHVRTADSTSLLQDVPEVLEFVQYLRGGGVAVVDCGPTPPGTVERLSPASTVSDDSAPQG